MPSRAPAFRDVTPYRVAEPRARLADDSPPIACPFCGGTIDFASRTCPHCDVQLEGVRCAHCFSLQPTGMRACTRCGKELELEPLLDPTSAPCPRCDRPLGAVPGERSGMHECVVCGGLFLDHATLAEITVDREEAGPIAAARPSLVPRLSRVDTSVRYVKCPMCHQLMNRANFGRKSGVIVDVCKVHGTWFDPGELTQAVEFVANGGLDGTRRREREDAEQAARDDGTAAIAAHAMMVNEGLISGYREARSIALTTTFVELVIRSLFG